MADTIRLNLGSITGDSSLKGAENWIPIQSFDVGFNRHLTMSVGEKRKEYGKASSSEASVGKYIDSSTQDIFKACMKGTNIALAKVTFTRTNENDPYLEYEMTNVLISSYVPNHGNDTEQFTLNYRTIQMDFSAMQDDSSKKASPKVKFDLDSGETT